MTTMNSQLLFISVHVLLCCILIGLINIPPCQSESSLYATCNTSFGCGNINITYPFWGKTRTRDCGYDQLELTCENGTAKIDIATVKYRLLEYYPDTQEMQIARDDYASGICSPNYTNTTLDPALFELAYGYTNISVIYGCPANIFAAVPVNFNCSVSGTSNTDGYVTVGPVGPKTCFASVVVPVSQGSEISNSSSSIQNLLHQGFGVRLKVDATSCNGCIQSEGVCGYDHSLNQTTCYCEDGTTGSMTCSAPTTAGAPQGLPTNGSQHKKWLTILIVCVAIVLIGTTTAILMIWVHKRRKLQVNEDNNNNVEVVINTSEFLAPRRYKYFELKKKTNSFSEKIGQGGFGTVYKGKFSDGQLVAVKVLIESKAHGEEFTNEVASISKTSHINVVSLLGFCCERKKRALVYEFMPNGSLDKIIPPEGALHTSLQIDWKILHQIVLGIARGLEYLHRGCKTRILHFDIKPQNILLDKDFVPKISDFGLAKLCLGNESKVSLLGIRGTIGYIAPEVMSRNFGRVSPKSDVYSYGMLVLAMVCGKSINNEQVSHSSDLYFPHYIYKQLEPDRDFKFQGIVTDEEEEIARKLILISFWCIQTNPSDRPSITKVINMMEGSLHSVSMPPEPFLANPASQNQNLDMACSSSSGKDIEVEESILGAMEDL